MRDLGNKGSRSACSRKSFVVSEGSTWINGVGRWVAHRPPSGRSQRDIDDGEAAEFLQELISAHKPVPGLASPGTALTLPILPPCHDLPMAAASSRAVLPRPDGQGHDLAPASSSREVPVPKRRRRVADGSKLVQLKEEVAEAIILQHASAMTLAGTHRAIHSALLRSWIRASTAMLAPTSLAGLVDSLAERCLGLVCAADGVVPSSPCVFKVGVTRDPLNRFAQADFKYEGEYTDMELLLVGFPRLCGYLESQLIFRLRSIPGCRNQAPGGESLPPDGCVCYLYIVTIRSDDLVSRRLRAVRGSHVPSV